MVDTLERTGVIARRTRLADGTYCRIRPIGERDRALIVNCFEGLSAESRRQRFFGAKPCLSEQDLAFLAGADGRDHIAIGALRLDARGAEIELLGAARCIRLAKGGSCGELALAIIDRVQGQGIGRALVDSLVEEAREQGFQSLVCEVMASNGGMRALMAGVGSSVRWLDHSTLEFRYELDPRGEAAGASPSFPVDVFALARLSSDAWAAAADRALTSGYALSRLWLDSWLERWSCSDNASGDPSVASGTTPPHSRSELARV